jgi:hypothetical protein
MESNRSEPLLLFTGAKPPRAFLTHFHGVLKGLVDPRSVVAKGTDQALAGAVAMLCLNSHWVLIGIRQLID